MKRKTIIVLIIIIILNILLLSYNKVNAAGLMENMDLSTPPVKDNGLIPQMNVELPQSSNNSSNSSNNNNNSVEATIRNILSIIQNENSIKALKDEQLDSYINQLNQAKVNGNYGSISPQTIDQAINTLQQEKKRRDVNNQSHGNSNSESELIDYILGLSTSEIQNLTASEINSYLTRLSNVNSSSVNTSRLNAAKNILQNERTRRANLNNSGSGSGLGFDYKDYTPGETGNYNKAISIAGNVLGIIRNIGVVVGIIALSIIGVKYMVGSVEQKANYKSSMMPFVIGAILLIIGPTLVKAIYDFMVNK